MVCKFSYHIKIHWPSLHKTRSSDTEINMGVPAFYRWLTQKFPKIVVYNIEKVRSETPDVEYDNLYIDMNGI